MRNTSIQHYYLRVFYGCREVSRSEMTACKFKRKIFRVTSCRNKLLGPAGRCLPRGPQRRQRPEPPAAAPRAAGSRATRHCSLEQPLPSSAATAFTRETHTRQERSTTDTVLHPTRFGRGEGESQSSITAHCTNACPSEDTDTHRQVKLLSTNITSSNKALQNQTLTSSDTSKSLGKVFQH